MQFSLQIKQAGGGGLGKWKLLFQSLELTQARILRPLYEPTCFRCLHKGKLISSLDQFPWYNFCWPDLRCLKGVQKPEGSCSIWKLNTALAPIIKTSSTRALHSSFQSFIELWQSTSVTLEMDSKQAVTVTWFLLRFCTTSCAGRKASGGADARSCRTLWEKWIHQRSSWGKLIM